MKRVVAVEGDTITPFGVGSTVRAPVKLGPGEVWVESDGGPGYLGSSVFGSVPISCIKVFQKYNYFVIYVKNYKITITEKGL